MTISGVELRLIGLRAQVVAVVREIDAMLDEARAPREEDAAPAIRVMGGARPNPSASADTNPEG